MTKEIAVDGELLAVTFSLAEQRYALPLDAVLQVVRLPALTTVAGAPPTICGLLNLQGQFLPVLDGRVLVGAEPVYSLDSCILILAQDGQPTIGLLADTVEAVRTFSAKSLTAVTHGSDFIVGMLPDETGDAILLGPEALQHVAAGERALQRSVLS